MKQTLGLILFLAVFQAHANSITKANLVADCDGWSVSVTVNTLPDYVGQLSYTLNPSCGAPVSGQAQLEANGGSFLVINQSDIWMPPLEGFCEITGTVEITDPTSINQSEFNFGEPVVLDCTVPSPEILVVKEISVDGGGSYFDANDAGSAPSVVAPADALYRITVRNTGNVDLTDILVNDPALGVADYPIAALAAGASTVLTSAEIPQLDVAERCTSAATLINIAMAEGLPVDGSAPISDEDAAVLVCTEPEPTGGEGCTPGYWKQRHHFDSWVGYSPSDSFEAVFGVNSSFNGTLLDALRRGGGKEKALGRHAVASLLSATNADVSFGFTQSDVITLVQDAYASGDFNATKDLLASENELGCPLN